MKLYTLSLNWDSKIGAFLATKIFHSLLVAQLSQAMTKFYVIQTWSNMIRTAGGIIKPRNRYYFYTFNGLCVFFFSYIHWPNTMCLRTRGCCQYCTDEFAFFCINKIIFVVQFYSKSPLRPYRDPKQTNKQVKWMSTQWVRDVTQIKIKD